jgi:hypothetical protein
VRPGPDQRIVRQADEVERVAALVGDLHERTLLVGLDDSADRPGGPAPRLS